MLLHFIGKPDCDSLFLPSARFSFYIRRATMPSLKQPLRAWPRTRRGASRWPSRWRARATCPGSLWPSPPCATRGDSLCCSSRRFCWEPPRVCRWSCSTTARCPARWLTLFNSRFSLKLSTGKCYSSGLGHMAKARVVFDKSQRDVVQRPGMCVAKTREVCDRGQEGVWQRPGRCVTEARKVFDKGQGGVWQRSGRCLTKAKEVCDRGQEGVWQRPGRCVTEVRKVFDKDHAGAWQRPGRCLTKANMCLHSTHCRCVIGWCGPAGCWCGVVCCRLMWTCWMLMEHSCCSLQGALMTSTVMTWTLIVSYWTVSWLLGSYQWWQC